MVKKVSRILCVVDFCEASRTAFDYSLALTKAAGARTELLLLFAVPRSVPFSWRAQERVDLLSQFQLLARDAGVIVRTTVQHGDPAGVILLHAHAKKPDAIVMGTNGRGPIARLRMPSVADKVVHGARCPTFVVRAFPGHRAPERSGEFRRILCGVKFSRTADEVLKRAFGFLGRGGQLTALNVLNPLPMHPPRQWDFVHTDGWARVRELVPELPEHFRGNVHARLAAGPVVQEILRVADETSADLIVIGAPAGGVVSRWRGSTATRLLRDSPIPVLVVPEAKRRQSERETQRRVA